MQSMNLVCTTLYRFLKVTVMSILPDTAGYVFAIAYESDPYKVTLDKLVVFSVRDQYEIIPFSPISY